MIQIMFLYIFIGAAIVLRKELYAFLSHMIPFIYRATVFTGKTLIVYGGKGVWWGVKHGYRKSSKIIKDVDGYMIERRWQR